ncbi:MAG: hypothetical protein QW424_01510 [Candidatus Bathyarchaeia archaeon]
MEERGKLIIKVMETYDKSPDELCHEAYPNVNKTLTKLLNEFNYMNFTRKENLPNPIDDR